MKKSEALSILGLANGATDDEVKKAHRKLVIAHHPDKFPLDSKERADAEELTKQINEARDVLLNRSWSPEFDPRRDSRPYANNPYAHPQSGGAGSPWQGAAGGQGAAGQNPFAQGWPFDFDDSTFVWTSWDSAHSDGGDPFDPFAAYRSAPPQKTPQEQRQEAAELLRRDALVIVAKLACLLVLAAVGSLATGLFIYVMTSIIYGLWKRFGSCLITLAFPLVIVLAPLVFLIAPHDGASNIALTVASLLAVLFDLVNLRDRVRVYWHASKQAAGK